MFRRGGRNPGGRGSNYEDKLFNEKYQRGGDPSLRLVLGEAKDPATAVVIRFLYLPLRSRKLAPMVLLRFLSF